jgi:hypothetical protein
MYEWLDDELTRIRWPGFHELHPCAVPDQLDCRLPPSFLAFARRYGAAKLYLRDKYYQLGVLCPPELVGSEQELLMIGFIGESEAVLRIDELVAGREARVYELVEGVPEEVAFDFSSWLEICAADCREEYGTDEWARLERGPDPFTADEEAIVEARKRFSWDLVGGGADRGLRFRIRNGSDRTLPALTIGVRHKDGAVEARLPVDVSRIGPGEEQIVEVPGYATLEPQDALAFELPAPTPATRDAYAELARTGPMIRPPQVGTNE